MKPNNLISFHPETCLAVIIDPRLSASSGQLRALPLLLKFGISKFSTIPEWGEPCQALLPDSSYTKYYPDLSEDCIAVFTSEKLERTQRFTASLFLDKLSVGEIKKCIYVVDQENFRIRRSLRPLVHNANFYYFEEIFKNFILRRSKKDMDFPLKDTYNIFLQDLAYRLQKILNKNIGWSHELFVYDERTVNEPIWDWLIKISEAYEESPTRDFKKVAMSYLKPLIENDYAIKKIVAKMENVYSKEFRCSCDYIKQQRVALRALS
ncbi:TPA: hypothetical protein ENX78_07180 [Candidatus Poribacteria bacterium]|jgi:hypothetical protein|nr:hypothetical protein [Candidatus Poribacteria bacterium]